LNGFFQDVHQRISDALAPDVRACIDSLLVVPELAAVSAFEVLKAKGQFVGTSGATGGANPALGKPRGPHLHFEFIPSGRIPELTVPPGLARVDPMPLIQVLSLVEPNTPPPQLRVGDRLQFRAIDKVGRSMAVDSQGRVISLQNLKWTSSNPGIASLDEKGLGLVTAKSPGKAKITANHTSFRRNESVWVRVERPLNGTWTGTCSGSAPHVSGDATLIYSPSDDQHTSVCVNFNNFWEGRFNGQKTGNSLHLKWVRSDEHVQAFLDGTVSDSALQGQVTGIFPQGQ
jgi:hypothetical protein